MPPVLPAAVPCSPWRIRLCRQVFAFGLPRADGNVRPIIRWWPGCERVGFGSLRAQVDERQLGDDGRLECRRLPDDPLVALTTDIPTTVQEFPVAAEGDGVVAERQHAVQLLEILKFCGAQRSQRFGLRGRCACEGHADGQ